MNVRLADPVRSLVQGEAVTIRPLATLRGAAIVLEDNLFGALLVRGYEGIEGILTERDLVRATADGVDLSEERVRGFMSEHLATVDASTSVRAAGEYMLRDEIRHLVVTDGADILGVVSMRDVMAVALREHAVTVLD